MTGSVLVVVIVVVAGVLYLLLRRRGSRGSEEIKPLARQAVRQQSDLEQVRPERAAEATGGLPPRPGPGGSGTSHPAYPVAPAKYAGAMPVRPGASGQAAVSGGGTVSRPELDPVAEARKAANAPAPTEPWYPEPPASYTEGGEPGKDESGQGRE